MAIEDFICSYYKPAWFKKLYQLSTTIGVEDPQVASRRLDVFCCCRCSLICQNVSFVCLAFIRKLVKLA